MADSRVEKREVRKGDDIVILRQLVRQWAVEMSYSLIDQTKLVTAASELARNTLEHGGGGEVLVETLEAGTRKGVRLTFTDHGPGIADVNVALRDGYTTGSGLGLGLGGAKRLSNEFEIQSEPNAGTRIRMARWR